MSAKREQEKSRKVGLTVCDYSSRDCVLAVPEAINTSKPSSRHRKRNFYRKVGCTGVIASVVGEARGEGALLDVAAAILAITAIWNGFERR